MQVLDVLDELFVSIFRGLEQQYKQDLENVNVQYPFEPFRFLEQSLRLKYKDAVAMLREAGIQMGDYDDLRFVFIGFNFLQYYY